MIALIQNMTKFEIHTFSETSNIGPHQLALKSLRKQTMCYIELTSIWERFWTIRSLLRQMTGWYPTTARKDKISKLQVISVFLLLYCNLAWHVRRRRAHFIDNRSHPGHLVHQLSDTLRLTTAFQSSPILCSFWKMLSMIPLIPRRITKKSSGPSSTRR